jgi:4-carboxymuconolactone decarboxylase
MTGDAVITDELYERGLAIRREMFGAEGAEAQVESTTEFTDKLQDIITRNCFGDIWSRPGLTRRERSLITVAMLVALGRPNQVAVHLRGAVANGVTPTEVRELLLHAHLYCGIPAMVDGFATASKILGDDLTMED